jgi:hypothetical protein
MLACALAIGCSTIFIRYLPEEITIKLLKYSIGILGIVWAFSMLVYNKLWDVTDLPGLDYKQHRNIEVEIRSRLQWFWLRAFFIGVLALIMSIPAIVAEAKFIVPQLIIHSAFCAFALALFSLRRLWVELEEIRDLKSHIKELERREKEREEQVKILKEGLKEGWSNDQKLDGFRAEVQDKNTAQSGLN